MTISIKKATPPAPAKSKALALAPQPELDPQPEPSSLTSAPTAKLTGKQAMGSAVKTFKDGTTSEELISVGTPSLLLEPHATVGLSMSLTRNLGSFESVKFTVSLYLPCAPEPEEIEATYTSAKEWVDAKTEEINQDINEQLG